MSLDDKNKQTEALLKEILNKINSEEFETRLLTISKEITIVKHNSDTVRESMTKLETEIDKMKFSADHREKVLSEVHKSIFDPDLGIYTKLLENKNKFENMEKSIKHMDDDMDKQIKEAKEELKSKIEESEQDINKQISNVQKEVEEKIMEASKRLETTEGKIKLIEVASGGDPNFSDLKIAVDVVKNFNKLWWALIMSVVGGLGKVIWDIVKEIQ